MSASNGTTMPMTDEGSHALTETTPNKGKGKAVDVPPQDMSMDEDGDSSDETGAEDDVRRILPTCDSIVSDATVN